MWSSSKSQVLFQAKARVNRSANGTSISLSLTLKWIVGRQNYLVATTVQWEKNQLRLFMILERLAAPRSMTTTASIIRLVLNRRPGNNRNTPRSRPMEERWQAEFHSLNDIMHTWDLVERPKDKPVLKGRWVLRVS
jgi:hypothetical protein